MREKTSKNYTAQLAALFGRLSELPAERREYWLNNFIEQIDESAAVWRAGAADWDSDKNAGQLEASLAELIANAEEPDALAADFAEEYAEEYALEAKLRETSARAPVNGGAHKPHKPRSPQDPDVTPFYELLEASSEV